MLILPSYIESYRSLKDKTYKITVETQEMTPQQLGELGMNLGEFGYLAFKKEPFKKEETDMLESLEADYGDGKKSPSQRLRGVLYRIWEKKPEGYEDFNLYYQFRLEKVITHFKSKLDDLS